MSCIFKRKLPVLGMYCWFMNKKCCGESKCKYVTGPDELGKKK